MQSTKEILDKINCCIERKKRIQDLIDEASPSFMQMVYQHRAFEGKAEENSSGVRTGTGTGTQREETPFMSSRSSFCTANSNERVEKSKTSSRLHYVKKFFRIASLFLHPDKHDKTPDVFSSSPSTNSSTFADITEARDNMLLHPILISLQNTEMDVEQDDEVKVKLLLIEELEQISKEIDELKRNIVYLWGTARNEDQRKYFISHFVANMI